MRRILLGILLLVLVFTLSGCYSCQSWHSFWGDGPRETYPPDISFLDKDCKCLEPPEPMPQK
jgi:hypothetical protein